MFNNGCEHFKRVSDGISGRRYTDSKTLESLDVLKQRLENLKSRSSAFAGVELSEHARQLERENSQVLTV
jgi:hypothetical protein